jgi:hypothetical protein
MGDEREDFEARTAELAGEARDTHTVEEVFGPVTHEQLRRLRTELGGYVDGLAERVAAVEALGGEARQAIANAHEVEEHYDELKRRLRIVATLLAAPVPGALLELVELVLEMPAPRAMTPTP